jgi:opacity protein-like surface antigen
MTRNPRWLYFVLIPAAVAGITVTGWSEAAAETYLAGEMGLTVPQSLRHVEGTTGAAAGAKITDEDLNNSILLGGKLGYFFDRIPWLGFELEGFGTTPHIEQQQRLATFPNGRTLGLAHRGSELRVLTWATNLVARTQWGLFTPYAGIGPAAFVARRKDPQTESSDTSTTVGLNTQVGLSFQLSRAFSVFGEWKYNHTRMHFDQAQTVPGGPVLQGFKGTYTAHLFVVGLTYHFK